MLAVTGFRHPGRGHRPGNDTDYGLAAAIWTADLNKAVKGSCALRAGTVFVNNWDGAT